MYAAGPFYKSRDSLIKSLYPGHMQLYPKVVHVQYILTILKVFPVCLYPVSTVNSVLKMLHNLAP